MVSKEQVERLVPIKDRRCAAPAPPHNSVGRNRTWLAVPSSFTRATVLGCVAIWGGAFSLSVVRATRFGFDGSRSGRISVGALKLLGRLHPAGEFCSLGCRKQSAARTLRSDRALSSL